MSAPRRREMLKLVETRMEGVARGAGGSKSVAGWSTSVAEDGKDLRKGLAKGVSSREGRPYLPLLGGRRYIYSSPKGGGKELAGRKKATRREAISVQSR